MASLSSIVLVLSMTFGIFISFIDISNDSLEIYKIISYYGIIIGYLYIVGELSFVAIPELGLQLRIFFMKMSFVDKQLKKENRAKKNWKILKNII